MSKQDPVPVVLVRDARSPEAAPTRTVRHAAKRTGVAVSIVTAILVISSCGTSTSSRHTTTPAQIAAQTVDTRTIGSLGEVIVNGWGRTLYVLASVGADKPSCSSHSCAALWHPDSAKVSWGIATASGHSAKTLIGTVAGPDGTRIITYAGWPLYTYAGDTAGGVAHGQALRSGSGVWYVISPSGKLVRTATSSPASKE